MIPFPTTVRSGSYAERSGFSRRVDRRVGRSSKERCRVSKPLLVRASLGAVELIGQAALHVRDASRHDPELSEEADSIANT